MANSGILLMLLYLVVGLGFLWYLISRGERRSIKTGRPPNEAEK